MKKSKIIAYSILVGSCFTTPHLMDGKNAQAKVSVGTQTTLSGPVKLQKPPISTRIKTNLSNGWTSFKKLFTNCFGTKNNKKDSFELKDMSQTNKRDTIKTSNDGNTNTLYTDVKISPPTKPTKVVTTEGNTVYTEIKSSGKDVSVQAEIHTPPEQPKSAIKKPGPPVAPKPPKTVTFKALNGGGQSSQTNNYDDVVSLRDKSTSNETKTSTINVIVTKDGSGRTSFVVEDGKTTPDNDAPKRPVPKPRTKF